ncbi:hypothetical protein ACLOJK_025545 [Asimina triloba]
MASNKEPVSPISSNQPIPLIGLGTAVYPFGDCETLKSAILHAIKLGYRHFDAAAIYRSEQPMGEAITEALHLGLISSREKIFITSKLWLCDNHGGRVQPALQKKLRNLGLDYLNLDLMHWPRLGLTKSIGVSNFSCKKLTELFSVVKIPPALNQKKLRELCSSRGIHVSACSPLGGNGTPWSSNQVLDSNVLKDIAQARGKTVALRWVYLQGVSVIVRSLRNERLKENLQILDWSLTEEELRENRVAMENAGAIIRGRRHGTKKKTYQRNGRPDSPYQNWRWEQGLSGLVGMNMINVGSGACNKRKREERVFKFKTFCDHGHPTHFDGPFRRNIQALLEYGRAEWGLLGGMQSWSFRLEVHRHPPVQVSLFIVEEPIETSVRRHCHHCRRFHFVLPSKETMAAATSVGCQGSHVSVTTAEATTVMPAKQQQQQNFVELQGHLMHAVMHSNGFGHLLCLNGMEGGSEFISGHQIMDLWNRICTGLRARKVSLSDTAKKRTMELRLIHGIGYSEPWFGRWGYQFGRGSYGVTQQTYHKAIQALRAIPLRMLTPILPEISAILLRYQTMSGHSLQTLGHLFHFILELRGRIPLHSLTSTAAADPLHHGIMAAGSNNCRWSSKRVEMAIWVIVEALKKAEFRWVSRQEVRDAARLYIGDTGLLDFVLKSLGNHVVGNYVVRRAVNPVTKVLEYCLEDVSSTAIFPQSLPAAAAEDPKTNNIPPPRLHVTRAQLMKDIYCLYKHVLMMKEQRLAAGMLEAIPAAVRIVLDVKHLVKDYKGEMFSAGKNEGGAGEEPLRIMCTISLRQRDHHDHVVDYSPPPHELIVLPSHATVGDLKMEVERCFREVYWCLRSFTAESVVGLEGRRDGDLLRVLVGAGASVVVRGTSSLEDVGSDRSCEGGNSSVWLIDCPCGAKEDDGERMVSCDICEVWQHTRCVGVSDEFPQIFLCSQCEHKIVIVPPLL